MPDDIRQQFDSLQERINAKFDHLQAETAARFRTLTRSTGQYLSYRKTKAAKGFENEA